MKKMKYCKMIRIVFFCLAFSYSLVGFGQNIYDSKLDYYNVDTSQCVDNDSRFWDGDELKARSGNPDSVGLYFRLTERVSLPILEVTDKRIIRFISSCIKKALKGNYLYYPDSSGFFVDVSISKQLVDSLSFMLRAEPLPNYRMGTELRGDNYQAILELTGKQIKNLFGCFYLNDILCVVSYAEPEDMARASCFFRPTQSTIRLNLYSPIWFRNYEPDIGFNKRHVFPRCSDSQ